MKPALPALITYMASNNSAVIADLYTFAFLGGGILRLVDYPLGVVTIPAANFPGSPLNFASGGSVTFTRGPRFSRTKVTTSIGLDPAELVITAFPSTVSDFIAPGITWQYFSNTGGFDGASVELDRFFMPIGGDGIKGTLDTSLGAVTWFYGKMAEVEVQRSQILLHVKSLINVLQQQQMPRRLFQSGCTHVYGDAMCGYDRVNGKNALGTLTGVGASTVTALTGSDQGQIVITSPPASFYVLGTCVGLSGQNLGISRGIDDIVGTTVGFSRQFPFLIQIGDTFQLLPGCDHTSSTCNLTMLNILRYGGFDYIPPPEFAL